MPTEHQWELDNYPFNKIVKNRKEMYDEKLKAKIYGTQVVWN